MQTYTTQCEQQSNHYFAHMQEVLEIIRAQSGDRSSVFLSYLLRFSLLFTRDPFASSVRRLKALKLDLGKSFTTSDVKEHDRCSSIQTDAEHPFGQSCGASSELLSVQWRLDLSMARGVVLACRSAQLDIQSCLYNNVFAEEGEEQLLECCCCSQDAVWWVSHPSQSLFARPSHERGFLHDER